MEQTNANVQPITSAYTPTACGSRNVTFAGEFELVFDDGTPKNTFIHTGPRRVDLPVPASNLAPEIGAGRDALVIGNDA